MASGIDGALIRDVLIGIGVLLAGIGILVVCTSLASTLKRVGTTLDEVDRQIAALSAPVVTALDHVGGIADTADTTVARLGAVVGTLENLAEALGRAGKFAGDAFTPALVNVGATLAGVTAGLRRLLGGRPVPEPGETIHG